MNHSHWKDSLFVLLQRLLPTRALSGLMYRLTRVRWVAFKNLHIRLFMRGFGISLDDAEQPDPTGYATFNDFFTRALKPGARPVSAAARDLISPVDGTVSQLGRIQHGRVFQAKGHDYSLEQLLGGDTAAVKLFENGSFCTIYLAPYNYHRIHMPLAGTLSEWTHVPGRLYSVNPATVRELKGVFALNERIVCSFNHPAGPWKLVMVGALFVGSMETVWAGQITPPYLSSSVPATRRPSNPVGLTRGEEMGRFNMGSTVILLFPEGRVAWNDALRPGVAVRMGQSLGCLSEV